VVAVTYSFPGPDPLEAQLKAVLDLLAGGSAPYTIERAQVPAVLDWLNWHEQATARFATPAADIDLF